MIALFVCASRAGSKGTFKAISNFEEITILVADFWEFKFPKLFFICVWCKYNNWYNLISTWNIQLVIWASLHLLEIEEYLWNSIQVQCIFSFSYFDKLSFLNFIPVRYFIFESIRYVPIGRCWQRWLFYLEITGSFCF